MHHPKYLKHLLVSTVFAWMILLSNQLSAQCSCNTVGFENNSLGCWDLKHGKFYGGNKTIWTNYTSSENNQHTITNIGEYDPIADCVSKNFLSQVAPGSTHSLRLGDSDNGFRTASASIDFVVTESTTLFQLQYAVVFSDPGHPEEDQPRFKVIVNTECGDYFVVSDKTIEGFRSCNNDWRIKPWETVGINLSNYVGQTVSLEFISTDCGRGAHGGYAYIDAGCLALDINIANYCPGDANIILEAPEGFSSYLWTNTNTGATFSGRQISVTDPVGGETYRVDILSVTGCTANLEYTLPPLTSAGAISLDYVGEKEFCAGGSGTINIGGDNIGVVTVNGQVQSGNSITVNPLVTTEYNVRATSADACGEDANLNFTINVNPFPAIDLRTSSNVVCPDEVVTLSYTPQVGIDYEWVGLNQNNTESLELPVSTTTEFILQATSATGCEVKKSITVFVIEEGEVAYDINRITVCPPGAEAQIFIDIDNIASLKFEYLTYLTEGNSPTDTLKDVDGANGLFTIYPQTSMALPLTITTKGGCAMIEDTVFIDVLDEAPSLNLENNQIQVCPEVETTVEIKGSFDSLAIFPEPLAIQGSKILIAPFQTTNYEIEAFRSNCNTDKATLLAVVATPPNYTIPQEVITCKGESIEATIDIDNSTSIKWLHNDSTNPSQTFQGDTSKQYLFEVSSATSCTIIDTLKVTVAAEETIEYTLPDLSICKGTNALLGVRSNQELSIYWPTLGSDLGTIAVTPNTTTTYPVEITSETGCTTISENITVEVLTSDVDLEDIEDVFLCPQDSILIEVKGNGIIWEELDTITNTLLLPIDTITTYTLRSIAADSFTCPSAPIVFNVFKSEMPGIDVSIDQTAPCSGEEITLSVELPTTITTAYWEDTQEATLVRTVIFEPEKELFLILTDDLGCENRIGIPLNDFSTASAPNYRITNFNICSGEEVKIDLQASNYSTIIWENLPSETGSVFSIQPTRDTILKFSIESDSKCIVLKDSILITVNTVEADLPNTINTCLNEPFLLPFPDTGMDSIQWTDLGLTTSDNFLHTVAESGVNLTALIYGANGCTISDTITIRTLDDAEVNISTAASTICRGDTTSLKVSLAEGSKVTWFTEEMILGTTGILLIQPDFSTTYSVQIESAGGCISSNEIDITVLSPSLIQYNGDPYLVCEGESVNIDIAASNFSSIIWEDFPTITSPTFEFYPSKGTVLTFQIVDESECLTIKDSIAITVQRVSYTLPDTITVCAGEDFLLPFSVNELDSIRWNSLDTTVTTSLLVSVQNNRSFDATLYGIAGCQNQDKVVIIVEQPIINIFPPVPILCKGETILLENTGTNAYTEWSTLADEILSTNISVSVNPLTTTSYILRTITNEGCEAIDTVRVTVVDPQTMSIDNRVYQICEGEAVTITVDCDPIYSIYWQEEYTGCNITLLVEQSGFISFSYQDIYGCISVDDSVYVEVIPLPVVEFIRIADCVYPSEIIVPDTVCTECELIWQDGSNESAYEIPTDFIPEHLIVTAYNECGITTDSLLINSNSCKIFAPNAFSPNRDGINDLWKLESGCNEAAITEFELRVFNRWGDLLFSSNNIQEGWDGGEEQNGVYTWFYRYYDPICQKQILKSGDITIIR